MLDTEAVSVQVPSGPYPRCLSCQTGMLLPLVEPATGVHSLDGSRTWIKGTVVMYWRCQACRAETR